MTPEATKYNFLELDPEDYGRTHLHGLILTDDPELVICEDDSGQRKLVSIYEAMAQSYPLWDGCPEEDV